MNRIQDSIVSRIPPKKCGIAMYQTHSEANMRVLLYNNGQIYQLYDGPSDEVDFEHVASRVEQAVL